MDILEMRLYHFAKRLLVPLKRKFRNTCKFFSCCDNYNSCKKITWYLRRPKLPKNADGTVNLHVGCGGINHASYINIDLVPYPHVHYLRAIDNLADFKNETVDLIYASHCLEHFSIRHVPNVLHEWCRVLKIGGILRLSVPDFESLVNIYKEAGSKIDIIQEAIVGGQDYEYNFHYVIFNEEYLTNLLKEAGFSFVRRWETGKVENNVDGDFSSHYYMVKGKKMYVSLNLEAIK